MSEGRLHVVHVGVYAVGHRSLTRRGWWMAGVLACGNGSVLGFRSAAALWEIARERSTVIEVVLDHEHRRAHPGVRVRRSRRLDDEDRAVCDGIPVTSVARTLLDLAMILDLRGLTRALEAAERNELFDLDALVRARSRFRRRRGLRNVDRLIAAGREPALTRSELERRFLDFCGERGLPPPVVNSRIAGIEVDMHWPGTRLVVELDGYRFHRTRGAFERDRRRDSKLAALGLAVVRVTARRMHREPEQLAHELTQALVRSTSAA